MLVASALGSLGLGQAPALAAPPPPEPGALPEPPPDGPKRPVVIAAEPGGPTGALAASGCPTPDMLSELSRAEHERLWRKGLEAYRTGALGAAREALGAARAILPTAEVLRALGKVELESGRLGAARASWEAYLACLPPDAMSMERTEVERVLEDRLRPATVRLLVDPGLAGATVTIDGTLVGTVPWAEPVFVPTGEHDVTIRDPQGGLSAGVTYVDAGSDFVLTRARIEPPVPCLSVAPDCCPPSLLDSGRGAGIGLALGPHVLEGLQDGREHWGVGGAVVVSMAVGSTLEVRGSAFAIPTGGEGGVAMPVGGAVSMYLALADWVGVATHLAGGYWTGPEPSRDRVGFFEPAASSAFLSPALSPVFLRFGCLEIEPRVGLVFGRLEDRDGEHLGLSQASLGIWSTYLFLVPQ